LRVPWFLSGWEKTAGWARKKASSGEKKKKFRRGKGGRWRKALKLTTIDGCWSDRRTARGRGVSSFGPGSAPGSPEKSSFRREGFEFSGKKNYPSGVPPVCKTRSKRGTWETKKKKDELMDAGKGNQLPPQVQKVCT